MRSSCGDQWDRVRKLLAKAGLNTEKDDCISSPKMVGEQGLPQIAEAIVILVDAECFGAACTLVRMCESKVRLALLTQCRSQCVDRLRNCNDPMIRKSVQRALDAAAQNALGHHDVVQLLGLLPFCSEATSESVKGLFPPLDEDKVKELTNDELAAVLRIVLERIQKMGKDGNWLRELYSILAIAKNPEVCNLPKAMTMMRIISPVLSQLSIETSEVANVEFLAKLKRMAWLELTPKSFDHLSADELTEVLGIAVELAASSQTTEECVNRVRGLAALSDRIDESAAKALRSTLIRVVLLWLVRWSERDYEAYKNSLQETLTNLELGLRPDTFSIRARASVLVGRPASRLSTLADNFRRAVDTDDLRTAALLIRDCPYPEFSNPTRERLSEAVIEKLAVAGYQAELRPFGFKEMVEKSTDVEQEEQRSVALQVAVVLAATGDPECSQFAGTILSIVFPMPEDPEWAIRRMVGEPKPDIVGAIPPLIIYALPLLCKAELSPELDVILKMNEGEKLVAKATVDGFLNGKWNNAKEVLLFNALAHRIDLGSALPAIQPAVPLEAGGKARIEQVLDGPPLTALRKLASWSDFSAGQVRHVHRWARGWRLLWIMLTTKTEFLDEPAFLKEPMLLMGAIAIDAAAADGRRGGADELLHRLKFPWAQEALDAMLQIRVNDKPLLSDDDLQNVLRAMLSDEQLGRDMFIWMGQVDNPIRKVELHAQAAHALISLAGDSSRCRFYPKRRADHAVSEMVRMFEFRLRFLNIGKAVATKMDEDAKTKVGKKAWREISLKFPPGRTGAEPGLGQD